jgi:glycosyltransferase involved in cell wall biosynthesis
MPALSLIIPTHERFRYAEGTVETILAMGDDIELIVSDTSAKNAWNAIVHPRLKVVRPTPGISVVDNFNIALSHATGDYVCFIGDDDLVAPEIVDITRRARALGVDAVRFAFPILFYWPDYLHRSNPEAYSGTVWVSGYSGRVRTLDTRAALREAANKVGHGVFDMPRAYCGLVARPLVKRIVARHGALFGGVSPDIYSAALIATHAQKTLDIDFPAVILGASGASTAGQSAAGRHVGGLRDNAHIRPFRDLVWHPLVPEFYSVPTVWGYSLIRALEQIKLDPPVKPNWGRLYAQCLLYHRPYWSFTFQAMRNFVREKSLLALLATLTAGTVAEAGWALRRVWRRLTVRFAVTKDERIAGVDTIAAASTISDGIIAAGPKPNLSST